MIPGHHIAPSFPGAPGSIRYLKRQEIDTARWDACIEAAPNGLIYGRSFYLDAMTAGQWDALVLEDYQAVMPLTWRRKAGIRYLCQPAFTQQTGIFARDISSSLIAAFLHQAGRHFRFAEIFLNYGNEHPTLKSHTNFTLALDAPYELLQGKYKDNLVRNLKKTATADLHYIKEFDLRTALQDYQREYAVRIPSFREEDYRNFEQLCFTLQERGQVLTRAITGAQQQVLSTAVLLKDSKRLYLLHFTTLPAGRKEDASHFLVDRLIQEWAGSGLLLDFEGSDHPGVARFYSNFGSTNQPYFFYRHNRLPWPLKLVKR